MCYAPVVTMPQMFGGRNTVRLSETLPCCGWRPLPVKSSWPCGSRKKNDSALIFNQLPINRTPTALGSYQTAGAFFGLASTLWDHFSIQLVGHVRNRRNPGALCRCAVAPRSHHTVCCSERQVAGRGLGMTWHMVVRWDVSRRRCPQPFGEELHGNLTECHRPVSVNHRRFGWPIV